MTTTQTLNPLVSPFLMWSRLAWKTGEMAITSAQVIAHRTSRLARAGATLGQHDQREMALMGREKGDALLESAQAVWLRMLGVNQQFATLALKQMMSTSAALMSITSSRTAAESAARQSKLVRDTVVNSAAVGSKLSGAAAQLMSSAARPVHARINRNAKRLRRAR